MAHIQPPYLWVLGFEEVLKRTSRINVAVEHHNHALEQTLFDPNASENYV